MLPLLLSVTHKPLMQSVILLNAVMLNVIMLNAIMLNVFLLNVIMLNVFLQNVIMLNFIMLNVIMLNVMKLNVIRLNVSLLNVVKLNVVAPCLRPNQVCASNFAFIQLMELFNQGSLAEEEILSTDHLLVGTTLDKLVV
jgi:hypothetical protein